MHRSAGRARETLSPSSHLPQSGLGMSPPLLGSSRAEPAVTKATTAAESKETSTTPPRFSKPMSSGESGSSCLTSSPSPRVRNSESRGDSDAPPTSNGGLGWEGNRRGRNGGDNERPAAPRPCGGHDSDLSRRSIWTVFDSPPHDASNRRALEQRKCDFKIIVVFRGGWCTSSHNLLKGELVPNRERKRKREGYARLVAFPLLCRGVS